MSIEITKQVLLDAAEAAEQWPREDFLSWAKDHFALDNVIADVGLTTAGTPGYG
jgi:hypothetical protein